MAVKTATESEKDQPECPKCKSLVVLYRVRTDDYLCRRCGTRFKKDNPKG